MSRILCIYHNPRCSKSRTALKYLEDNQDKYDYKIETVLYQKAPPTTEQLHQLADYLGLKNQPDSDKPWTILLRPDAKKLVSSWEETFDLIEKEPAHLERPFIVDFENKKAALGRPNLDDVEKLAQDV